MLDNTFEISLVVPVFNEKDNIQPLLKELENALKPLSKTYEIIFIDDCSDDGTSDEILQQKKYFKNVKCFKHKINCGQSAAMATGFKKSLGDIVITMDADLQNVPADIPLFLEALTSDVDCVCGIRGKRIDTASKRFASKCANRIRNFLTGDSVADAGCCFRAIRQKCLVEIPVFNGMHRFIPTLLRASGFIVKEIHIQHAGRLHGYSKYGINNRMWRGLYDCFAMRWYKSRVVPAERGE